MNAINAAKIIPATGSSGDDKNINDYLFTNEKLTTLSNWPEISAKLSERNLLARPLKLSDYDNGYLELLSELTEIGEISRDEFEERFKRMRDVNRNEEHYLVVVIEDLKTGKVVAASTLFLELKFIHQCAIRGRLEDVSVLHTYRGQRIGEIIVKIIVDLAREVYNCYKLTLDCRDELIKFYAKNEFTYCSNMLCIRFK